MMLLLLASCLPLHEVDEENVEKFPFNDTKLKQSIGKHFLCQLKSISYSSMAYIYILYLIRVHNAGSCTMHRANCQVSCLHFPDLKASISKSLNKKTFADIFPSKHNPTSVGSNQTSGLRLSPTR